MKDDLRRCIYLCRMFRKDAIRRGDWSSEIFAESQLVKARKKYRDY